MSSERIGRSDHGLWQVQPVISNFLLSQADFAEYIDKVFGDDFGGKHDGLRTIHLILIIQFY